MKAPTIDKHTATLREAITKRCDERTNTPDSFTITNGLNKSYNIIMHFGLKPVFITLYATTSSEYKGHVARGSASLETSKVVGLPLAFINQLGTESFRAGVVGTLSNIIRQRKIDNLLNS